MERVCQSMAFCVTPARLPRGRRGAAHAQKRPNVWCNHGHRTKHTANLTHSTGANQSARITRRQVLRTSMLSTVSAVLATTVVTDSSGGMHTELSELASRIPGAGMPDVYYPDFFEGEWLVNRELYSVKAGHADPSGHTMLSQRAVSGMRDRLGRRESFTARFVVHHAHVIEDRLHNTKAELSQAVNKVHVSWERDKANVLTAEWGGGQRLREVKVTKRSFVDGPHGYGTFVASEYARVVDMEGEGARIGFGKPPSVFARRRIVRYKVSSVTDALVPDGLDRIVVDYLYAPGEGNTQPSVVLKYRDFLNRKHGSELLTG